MLPDGHLIIENSFVQEPLNLDRLVFELQVDGYRPILAHPERYFYYYENLDRYRALHDAGVEFQINLLSLAGYYGKGERRIAEKLIDMGLVDFVGTDLHGRRHVESIRGYMATREFRRHRSALEKVIKNGLIPDNWQPPNCGSDDCVQKYSLVTEIPGFCFAAGGKGKRISTDRNPVEIGSGHGNGIKKSYYPDDNDVSI